VTPQKIATRTLSANDILTYQLELDCLDITDLNRAL
jgi:hypothetical protein